MVAVSSRRVTGIRMMALFSGIGCLLVGADFAAAQTTGRTSAGTSTSREPRAEVIKGPALDRYLGKNLTVECKDGRTYSGSLLKIHGSEAISVYSAASRENGVFITYLRITEISCDGRRIFPANDADAAIRRSSQKIEREFNANELAEQSRRVEEVRRQRALAAAKEQRALPAANQQRQSDRRQEPYNPRVAVNRAFANWLQSDSGQTTYDPLSVRYNIDLEGGGISESDRLANEMQRQNSLIEKNTEALKKLPKTCSLCNGHGTYRTGLVGLGDRIMCKNCNGRGSL